MKLQTIASKRRALSLAGGLWMRVRPSILAAAIMTMGCGSVLIPDSTCRCQGDVPEGALDLSCGESICLNGSGGYRCTDHNVADFAPEVCDADGGVELLVDSGSEADAGSADGGVVLPTGWQFTPFIEDSRLGMVEDIWSAGPGDTWFVTSSGEVIHHQGGTDIDTWSFRENLHAVYGTGTGHVWVVGEDGLVANFDGETGFSPLRERPFSHPAVDTWGDDENRYLAGNTYGRLEVSVEPSFDRFSGFDGGFGGPDGTTQCVGGSPRGLWVCADDGVYGHDGEWHRIFDGDAFAITVVRDHLAVAIESYVATLVNFQQIALSGSFGPHSLATPPGIEIGGSRLTAVWGDENELWVVGTRGYAARMTNYGSAFSQFSRIDTGTTEDLSSVFADSESIWLGGEGMILRSGR